MGMINSRNQLETEQKRMIKKEAAREERGKIKRGKCFYKEKFSLVPNPHEKSSKIRTVK